MQELVALIITVSTWLTPMPQHAAGKIGYYGPQYLAEANADFHGYDLAPYIDRCGLAVMSPADLGKIVWLRAGDSEWYGPCLGVDVAQRVHFYDYVTRIGELVEVPQSVREHFGFEWVVTGEVWVGACPPGRVTQPESYAELVTQTATWDHAPFERTPSFAPYPPQQWPEDCDGTTGLEVRR